MSVIQTLRDKYATVVVIVVCISLVAFLLMDAFVGPKSFFKRDTEVVTVNGDGLQYQDFMQLVQQQENIYQMNNPQAKMNDDIRHQIRTQVYNKFVQDQVLGTEYEKLGIGFSSAELRDLTLTMDAAPQIKQNPGFQNPNTGEFDPNRVASFLQNIRNAPQDNQQAMVMRQRWLQIEDYLQNSSLITKFTSLITQGLYVPKWLSEEKLKENNTFSNISFVAASYSTVPDSAVSISNEELQAYLNEHSKLYQVEASRSLEYVSFDIVPSPEDSARILGGLKELVPQFDTVSSTNMPGFLTRNSESQYTDRYIPGSLLQSSVENELIALPEGKVYGPYFDNGMVVYARKMGEKKIADTVDVQQLLISTQITPDSTARFRVDSIKKAIQNGANFTDMVNTYSDAQKENGGELVLTPDNPNIPTEFIQYVNNNGVGSVGVVKTQFGYHLVKITDKKHMEMGYKIAYLSQGMDPSQKTDNVIFSEANKFRGLNQTREQFEKTAKEKGYTVQVAKDVQATAFNVNELNSARDLIKWAFDANVNDVSNVFSIGNHYVIAVLTGKSEKGTASLASVRPQIEAVVRRKKKAEQIAAKIKGSTLSEIASGLNDSVSIGQHISFTTPFIPNSGFEPKVVGAAFNPVWKDGKVSKPVFGNNGVYVLTIDSLHTSPVDSTQISQIKQQNQLAVQREVNSQILEVLKKEADIDDRRIKFF